MSTVVEFLGEAGEIQNSIDFCSLMNMFKGLFCILSHHLIEGLGSQKIWQADFDFKPKCQVDFGHIFRLLHKKLFSKIQLIKKLTTTKFDFFKKCT